MRHRWTYDQAEGMTRHRVLIASTAAKVCFFDSHSLWQRGRGKRTPMGCCSPSTHNICPRRWVLRFGLETAVLMVGF